MLKFIHLTDPHLVPAPRRLYALDPRERLAAAVADIAQRHRDAAFAVITGDLTHFGEAGAYDDLKAILAPLPLPCHLLLGNHDARPAFCEAFPETPRDPAGFVQYVVETPDLDCILLDSLIGGTDEGELCEQRLAWLDATLAERRGRDLLVFLHHAPLDLGIPGMDLIKLRNAEALGDRLAAHGGVRHIFFGHVHRQIAGSWRGMPFSTLPATAHQVLLQFHVPEEVPGSHEPPAYGVVLVDRDSLVIHTHAYLDRSRRFLLDDKAAESAQSESELPGLDKALEFA